MFAGKARNDAVSRPVLVLGWIPRIVLTIARSLHSRGIPVDVADCVSAPWTRSRAVRNFFRLPYPNTDPLEFFIGLKGLIDRGGHDMLIPADDLAIAAVLEHYEELQRLITIACPPPEITRGVLNKTQTLEAARHCCIRVPQTETVFSSAALLSLAGKVPLPWILKPAEKEKRFEEFTSCKIDTIDEVSQKYPTTRRFEPPMLVQEYCEGVGVGVQMLMHEGKSLATFQHRRLKELPYGGGVAVTAVAERPDPNLVDSSLSLLRTLQWEGVAMVEFRVNQSTGEAVLMEVNGRYWGTVSLPVSAGLDFPYYHWQIIHGLTPAVPRLDVAGKRWRWTVGYFNRLYGLMVLARRSAASRTELKKTLVQLPSDFTPSFTDALFDISDPAPAILELAHTAKFLSGHSLKAMMKRVPLLLREPPTTKVTRP